MAPHSSTLAWKIPWTEEPGRLQSMVSLRVGHNWATSLSLFTFVHWRRKWQPTPVFFPGESQGRWSLMGCRLWGRTVRHDWSDLAAATAGLVFLLYVSSAVTGESRVRILQVCRGRSSQQPEASLHGCEDFASFGQQAQRIFCNQGAPCGYLCQVYD